MTRPLLLVLLVHLVLGSAPGRGTAQLPDTLDGAPYRVRLGERASVRATAPDSVMAEQVLRFLEGLPSLPGLPPGTPSGVVALLAHSPAAFDQATGGVVPEWRAGVAVPSLDLLVIPVHEGPSVLGGEGRRVLLHEWAHLGLHQTMEGLRIPRWFDEGYAQWVSGGFDAGDAWRLRVMIALGRGPSIDSLALRWPADREEARLAYLLAASAVAYLLEESGPRGLELFLARWREGGSFELAFRSTFGLTVGQFEEDWRGHVRRRYGWLMVLSHSTVFWIVLGAVLLLMTRARAARNREKLARVRADEPPDEPAFWAQGEAEPEPEPEAGPETEPGHGGDPPGGHEPSGGPDRPAPGV